MADKPPPYNQPPYPTAPAGGVVYTQPVQTVQVVPVQAPPKPPDYLILSVVVLLCCNIPFGIIALIFSLQSDSAYKAGRYDEAASKGRTARNVNIAGIVITIILLIVVVVLYVVVFAAAVSQYNNLLEDFSQDSQWGN